MAVFQVIGFDGFGSESVANGAPVRGAGLVDNPAGFTTVYGAASSSATGVSGQKTNAMGHGSIERNSLTMAIQGTFSGVTTITATWAVKDPAKFVPPVNGASGTLGFRFKMTRSALNPGLPITSNSAIQLLMVNGSSRLTYNSTAKSVRWTGSVQGSANFEFIENQEYYIEVVFTKPADGAANILASVYIDGVALITDISTPVTNWLIYSFAFGGQWTGSTWNLQLNYADIYLADRRLGPQIALTRQPSVLLEKNWTPSEGDNNLAMIVGAAATDDSKFITSPLTAAPDKYEFPFNLPEGYKAHAACMYLRGKRSPTSARSVTLQPYSGLTGEPIDVEGTKDLMFSQQSWSTVEAWFSDNPETMDRANINNLNVSLRANEV